ncbi:MAG: aquaporin [Candidatus Melainabacteria bacterium RIFOXYA2_FULL_32_9]|nr:MAG: aquaporin [Candidatus Melainabacteria bacterium RIFOXYA2_FULL_32_9]
MKKYIAEFIGTFILVFIGAGAAAIGSDAIGLLGIAIAFGFALIAAAYSIGPISGAHINPAATLGMLVAGRINGKDAIRYIISQFFGAIVAAAILAVIAKGKLSGYDIEIYGLGQNGYGPEYMGGYSLLAAMIFELIATFIFILVILESTQEGVPRQIAGFAIGITLAAAIILGIQITGGSLNPARSFGPALIVGGEALSQVWLFLIFPSIGGVLAGLFYRFINVSTTARVTPQE